MQQRQLGSHGLQVSAMGLGCMGMSYAYGAYDERDALKTLQRAVDMGITFFDTAEVYGPYTNEVLVGKALKAVRDKVVIATKFGFNILEHGEGWDRVAGVNSQLRHIRQAVEGSLTRLGIETIDLLYQHRVDPAVPVEDVVGVMAELVQEGKVRYLGLSEASAATLRRAHAIHPVSALQSEYSLWSRDVETDILPVCRELGVGLVPYSPLGRGFLSGKLNSVDDLAADDFRRSLPRFQQQALAANQKLLAVLEQQSASYQATSAQIALAWLLAKDPGLVPIPGARRIAHLEENVAATQLTLSAETQTILDDAFTREAVYGERYPEKGMQMVNL